ncbi:glycine oxidase ThiO [Ectocarpus siliculosus]|uniref:Glycine oxidase ThiO n=1 Tax=Ectocarpus siliculosus TaxID=2880 RepID=D7G5B9_ECTSI|nr:glycine oxidase ThiO [Ectocarpus siliculosus]|eukprot:CBJ27273.1 glycine oxidase ThiO [Ectocarpus siliculosus]
MAMLGPTMSDVRIHKDVVVIGGGLAGLSTALELAKRGKQVTVLSRNRAEAAAEAAGGMIAPQAERLESGPYLDLCLTSRAMYAEWVRSIEAIAGMGGEKAGEKTAAETRTHFWSTGGFMSPAFEGDAVHVWSPPPEGGQAHWIGRDQALEMEPSLSPDIVGAWWFPQDMSIDAQRMFRVLEQACSKGGVEILEGTAAASLVYDSEGTSVDAVVLDDGRQVHANAVVSATGAWMRELMPVPMVPHKGQMMALREPAGGLGAGAPRQGGGIGLTRVFFAEGCYIIPKRDGRIVVGSTVEVGEYGLHNTPAGIKQIIDAAVKVCPALADLAIERTWAGLRPVTPDCLPVLGASPRCPNLFVAGGYWRNGVLLAPKTGQLVADAVCGLLSPQDEDFLREFSMDRFTKPGTRAAAAARDYEPRAQPAAAVEPQRPAPTGTFSSSGSRAEGFISEASPSEVLEMERAALEGANDASMLSALEGMFGEGMVHVEKVEEENVSRDVPSTHASSTDSAPASSASSKVQEPVNDYHASEQFSEEKLKEARMANRLLQEDSSDARLESVFGGGPEEAGLPEGIANVNSWDDGAAEVASMIGAELVEMEVDIPDGMTIEEALAEQGPMMKVLLESPSGEEVEVPRGMNVAGMVEAGLIAPVGEADDDGEDFFGEGGAGARGWKVQEPPAGTFDPSAVKGAEERSTEVSELYAKVMANKAKAKAKGVGGGEASKTISPATTRNGHNGSNVKVKDGAKGANSWLGDILAMGHGSGGSKEKREVEDAHSSSGDKVEGTAHVGAGAEVTSESEGAAGEAEEMVGYDFILKDRGDEEGKVARSARALARDAPEGQEAWENYEKIANEAMASVGGMETVEYLPP